MPGEGEGKIHETKEPDECSKCESTQKSLVRVQAQPRVSVRAIVIKPIRQASRIEDVHSVKVGELRR